MVQSENFPRREEKISFPDASSDTGHTSVKRTYFDEHADSPSKEKRNELQMSTIRRLVAEKKSFNGHHKENISIFQTQEKISMKNGKRNPHCLPSTAK